MTSAEPQPLNEEGRQIRLVPLAPGFWWVLLGAGALTLGPLFGFLAGTMAGTDQELAGMAPIFFFLFVGFMVAGLGLGAILFGVRRLLHNRRETQV